MIPRDRFGRLLIAGLLTAALAGMAVSGFAQQPKKPGQHFSLAHQRPTFKEENVTPEVIVSALDTEASLSAIDEVWNTKFTTTPHYHKIHAETFYIVSGKAEWTVGGETKVVGAGDCVHIPVYTVHSVKVVGDADLHTVMIYQPGGFEAQMDLEASLTPEQRKDPNISKLMMKLADVYEAKAGDPVADSQKARNITKYFSFAATRPSYDDDGLSDVAVASIDGGGRIDLQDEKWNANFKVGPHFHKLHAELFYILDGRVEWTVGGETHEMSPGDAVYIPANTVHSAKSLDGKVLHTLLLYLPFGYDSHLEFMNSYTEEQLKDPAIKKMIRSLNDFNPADK
jgi:quercetin dioxygenase-like cupin family protein